MCGNVVGAESDYEVAITRRSDYWCPTRFGSTYREWSLIVKVGNEAGICGGIRYLGTRELDGPCSRCHEWVRKLGTHADRVSGRSDEEDVFIELAWVAHGQLVGTGAPLNIDEVDVASYCAER